MSIPEILSALIEDIRRQDRVARDMTAELEAVTLSDDSAHEVLDKITALNDVEMSLLRTFQLTMGIINGLSREPATLQNIGGDRDVESIRDMEPIRLARSLMNEVRERLRSSRTFLTTLTDRAESMVAGEEHQPGRVF